MVLQLPPKLKDDDQLSPHDLPAVEQFGAHDVVPPAEAPLVERGTLMPLNAKQLPQTIVNQLSALLAPAHLTGPLKLFYRPIFVAAIGLHALLLFAPGAKQEQKKDVKEKEKPVTITQISTGKAAAKKLNKLPTTKLKPTLPKLQSPNKSAPITKPTPKAEENKPAEKPEEKTPQSKPLPEVSPMPPGTPGDSIDPNNPFADFPHLGTKNAAEEYEVKGSTLAAAIAHFNQELPKRKYTIEPAAQEPSRAAFRFSKGGKEAYLNIFQEGDNVIYILAGAEVKSLEEWRGIVKVPDDFVVMISQLPTPTGVADGSDSETPDESHFDQPAAFFDGDDQFKAAIGGVSPRRVEGWDPKTLYAEQIEPVAKQVFDVTLAGEYGGGPLWEMKKGKTVLYLNLVPSTSKNGTNVVVWTQKPG
jgi:hypothetical protein